jgi:hypothetical protein
MSAVAEVVQAENIFATMKVIKVLPYKDCASIGPDLMKRKLDFKLSAAHLQAQPQITTADALLPFYQQIPAEFIYICRMDAELSFGLMFSTFPTAVFATNTKLNSSSAGGLSTRESFKRVFSKIHEITLDSLAREKFCPAECTIRQTGSPEKATQFCDSQPETAEISPSLWRTVGKFLWRWRRVNFLLPGAIGGLVLACSIIYLARTAESTTISAGHSRRLRNTRPKRMQRTLTRTASVARRRR